MGQSAAEFFGGLASNIDPEKIQGLKAVFQWEITGDGVALMMAEYARRHVERGARSGRTSM